MGANNFVTRKNLDVRLDKIKMSLTPKTKGIITIHLYGNSWHNMERIMKIAKENNLWVVEDTAEAIGSTFKEKLGSYGNIGVFSFHGTKTISTGERRNFINK